MEAWYTIYKEAKPGLQLSCPSHAYLGSNMVMWVGFGIYLVVVQVIGCYNGQSVLVD